MQQRKSALGRPEGTDGSDFSYRMVVDTRYTKVAKGKSRLSKLFIFQAVTLLVGLPFTFLWISKEGPVTLPVTATILGFVSLIIGESGRRNSRAGLLKLYVATSTVAVFLSLAFVIKSNFVSKVFQDQNGLEKMKLELIETGCILFKLLLHLFTISTIFSLIHNMSPPKRAS